MPADHDDIRLSNSMTVEHNTLGPGVIGHILRNRTINKSTYATTDRWFCYDQVGSVMATLDSNGSLVQRYWQDSFGNVQGNWSDGLWDASASGWHAMESVFDPAARAYLDSTVYDPQAALELSSRGDAPIQNARHACGGKGSGAMEHTRNRVISLSFYRDYSATCPNTIDNYGPLQAQCQSQCDSYCRSLRPPKEPYSAQLRCTWKKAIKVKLNFRKGVPIPIFSRPNTTGKPSVTCKCFCYGNACNVAEDASWPYVTGDNQPSDDNYVWE